MKKHKKENAEGHSYEEVKKQAQEQPLLRKTVRIGDLRIVDETHVEYKGKTLELSENAFHSLIKRLGVPMSFQARVSRLLGPQAKLNLLNTMKTAVSAQKNKALMFIGNPKNSLVVGVTEDVSMLSGKSFFELVEGTANKYNLDIKNCSIDKFGEVVIQTSSPIAAGIKGLAKDHKDDEGYYPGLAFKNSIFTGTELNPYTFRMVCSNGMIAPGRDVIRIAGFDTDELKRFYDRINMLAKGNFISCDYDKQVVKAAATYASLGELNFLSSAMMNYSGAGHKMINQFVPYYDCASKYEALGIKVENLDKQQLMNAKTNVKLWDAINGVTDFASHKYEGVDISSAGRATLQQKAGAILNKPKFDTESLMPSLI